MSSKSILHRKSLRFWRTDRETVLWVLAQNTSSKYSL